VTENQLTGIAFVAGAYLLGAVPWSVILGKLFGKADLRSVGSGSTGTTNALRAYGPKISIAVLVLDVAKGAAPVALGRYLGIDWWWIGLAAVVAVIGHCWSPFLGFDGGKGVATGYGAAIAMYPWFALAVVAMVGIVFITRYVSLGSIVCAIGIAVMATIHSLAGDQHWQVTLAMIAVAGVIVWRHRENIARLRAGKERTISFRSPHPTS